MLSDGAEDCACGGSRRRARAARRVTGRSVDGSFGVLRREGARHGALPGRTRGAVFCGVSPGPGKARSRSVQARESRCVFCGSIAKRRAIRSIEADTRKRRLPRVGKRRAYPSNSP